MSAIRWASAAAVAACLAFAGCGGDGLPRQLTPGQRADLHTLVAQARTAAGAGDLAATNAALARLKVRVRTLRDSGALPKEGAAELLKHAVLAELRAAHTIQAPAPTPPAAAATPPAAAVDPAPAVAPPPSASVAPAPAPAGGKTKQPKGKGRGKGAKQGD